MQNTEVVNCQSWKPDKPEPDPGLTPTPCMRQMSEV